VYGIIIGIRVGVDMLRVWCICDTMFWGGHVTFVV
jgi:hypothetical protein